VRDDYDDEFAIVRTPAEIARRRLFFPSVAFQVWAAGGIAGLIVGIFAAINDFSEDSPDDYQYVLFGAGLGMLALGIYLFAFVFVGGLAMRRLNRYPFARFAAFFMTALSIGGLYLVPLFPFGIWALIVLYGKKARLQFTGPGSPSPDGQRVVGPATIDTQLQEDFDDQFRRFLPADAAMRRRVRVSAVGMMFSGVLCFLAVLILGGYWVYDYLNRTFRWDEFDIAICALLMLAGLAIAGVIGFGGWCLLTLQRYRWSLVGAYFCTSRSLGGLLAILCYPFGIRALTLLHDPDVRKAFSRTVPTGRGSVD
jgi:hypothetical protein